MAGGTCVLKATNMLGYTDNNQDCVDPSTWNDGTTPTQTPGTQVTENAPYSSDTRPVAVGYTGYTPGGGFKPLMTTVYEGTRRFEELAGKALARGASKEDKAAFKELLGDLRRVTKSKLGTLDGQRQAYYELLQYSASSNQNMEDILKGNANVLGGDDGGSGSGRGGYSGPRASVVKQAESDIDATANALAIEMIGRTLTEKELNRITKRIRKAEVNQPTITSGSPAMTVQQQGLTAQGREDILREVIAKRPEFEKFQLDTTVMDAMNSYVQEKRAVVDV
jgi:hypothetical protein